MTVRKKITERALVEDIEDFEYFNVKSFFPSNPKCAVCIRSYKDNYYIKRIRGCGHIFHPLCLLRWLEYHPTCPVCRFSLEWVIIGEDHSASQPLSQDVSASPMILIEPLLGWSDDDEPLDHHQHDDENYYL